jgi:hypothetical protein
VQYMLCDLRMFFAIRRRPLLSGVRERGGVLLWVNRVVFAKSAVRPLFPDSDRTADIAGRLKGAITGCTNSRRYSALPPDPRPRIAVAGFTRKSYSLSELLAHAAVTLAALVHPDRRARRDPAVFHRAA